MDNFSPGSSHTRPSRFRGRRIVLLAAIATVLATPVAPAWAGGGGPSSQPHYGPNGTIDVNTCPDQAAPGTATCFARHRIDQGAQASRPTPAPGAKVAGAPAPPPASPNELVGGNGAYSPAYLQSAYNAPVANRGVTVAIVNAYDNDRAESDLAYYRSYFGLPPCTTANGCFRKVDQRGGTTYPAGNQGWGNETALDLDMVSALCPNCQLLLVEADSNSIEDLGTAENQAVALGASVVSNSWGGGEYAGEATDSEQYFHHPGVAIIFSSGDSGYGTLFPSVSPYVVAAGGTTLHQASDRGTRDATETAWIGSGSGCSSFMAKPSWQHNPGCSGRVSADVSAVADPSTGVWVWNTYPLGGGWGIFGGTSASAPIIAGLYGLAGNAASTTEMPSTLYGAFTRNPASFNDVTSGNNGSCGGNYLCTALPGYDGPTGLGTPNGIAPFLLSSAPPATTTTPPTGLTAVFGHSIDLAWLPAAGTVAAYVVERDGVEIGRTANTWYYDTTELPGTTYTYDVRTLDPAGNLSAPSNFATVTAPLDIVPPNAPSSLRVAVAGTTQVALYWTPSTDNVGVTGYDVYRDGVQVASTGGPNYVDTGLTPATSHVYVVRARDAAGNTSAASQALTAKTSALPAPGNLRASSTGTTQITLSWTPSSVSAGIVGYDVYRNGTQIAQTTLPSYLDSGLTPGTSPVYTVRARDAFGNTSAFSSATGKTLALPVASNLKAAVTGMTQVAFYWTPSAASAGIVGYDVYRDGVLIAQTTLPNYFDSALTPGTTHVYAVRTRDAAGHTSSPSSNLTARLSALSTSSTGTIVGVAYGQQGKPLANAVAQLSTGNGLTMSATAGSTGVYKFSSLPPGTYTLTITPPTSVVASAQTVPGATAVAGQVTVLVASF